ncbi:MAG: hypothetical protein NW224_22600 [Leptolyngbyaceae cyanobacterium bins.302]|nr:hypothetical protein [Leptolyngbyaceae cyanobacterium bins.302]
MHQISTTQSPVRLHPSHPSSVMDKQALHPVLQVALASLDVQLEAELIRYRRQRALGKAGYSPGTIAQRQVSRALDLMPATSQETLPPITSTSESGFHPTATVPPLASIASAVPTVAPTSHSLELKQLAEQYASQVAEASDLDVSGNGSPDDYLESSEELLRTLSQEESQVQAEQGFMQSLLTPLGIGSMLLLLMSSALFGFVIMNPNSVTQLLTRQSNQSEASSGGLTPPETATDQLPQPNLANQEFPELSLGNLGSIPLEQAMGSVSQPPSAKAESKAANLGLAGVASGVKPSAPVLEPGQPQVQASDSEPPAGDIPSPRKLAPATPDTPPATRTYEPPAPRSYNPPPARPYNPPVRPYTPPARAYSSPAKPSSAPRPLPAPKVNAAPLPSLDRTPLPPAPSPAASAPPATHRSSGYKVVTPYTSDKALEDYRGKVPDAYVKNYSDGAKVQFGAYQDESAAKSQVDELRKQGIPAEVYKP